MFSSRRSDSMTFFYFPILSLGCTFIRKLRRSGCTGERMVKRKKSWNRTFWIGNLTESRGTNFDRCRRELWSSSVANCFICTVHQIICFFLKIMRNRAEKTAENGQMSYGALVTKNILSEDLQQLTGEV